MSKEDPVFLVLNNHSSNISLGAKWCGHALPAPHASHRLQSLDFTYGPLKGAYNKECDVHMMEFPKVLTSDVPNLFKKASLRVANMEKAVSDFRVNIFGEDIYTSGAGAGPLSESSTVIAATPAVPASPSVETCSSVAASQSIAACSSVVGSTSVAAISSVAASSSVTASQSTAACSSVAAISYLAASSSVPAS
ncbi:hypothetical protein PR048_005899 [Dryococelus australis]|uniref:Uncharacterized protein n=1 Tax=Dryococelus australis TaxID=614101 RepID=A0ABQ9I9H3_9NEOP|nr:hypothetical protein PR048_005899 [Dryococelus australis]